MTAPHPDLQVDVARIEHDLVELASLTSRDDPYTRLAFSPEEIEARVAVKKWMEEANLKVRLDSAANIIGHRAGTENNLPVIILGSHIDTVQSGGRFDGMAGVVASLEVCRVFDEMGITTNHPIEVVVFTCEEPSVAGSPIGSRAMAGTLDFDQFENARDPQGLGTLAEAIDLVGGCSTRLREAKLTPKQVKGYLELHIEQGPVLEKEECKIGVVNAIATSCRCDITVLGRADHAGATMMHERADALVGAAEIILALEDAAREPSLKDAVATVGVVNAHPGMVNIIPGRVELRAETRSVLQQEKDQVKQRLSEVAQSIADRRGLTIETHWKPDEAPVAIPQAMQDIVEKAALALNIRTITIPSRAYHDANAMAEITPVGMVFVPSHKGLSHCPEEWTDFADIGIGTRVLGRALLELDSLV